MLCKTISAVSIPNEYFSDFLRGYFDGDGTSYSFYDSIFPKSYRFYVSFISASPEFVNWLREKIYLATGVKGHLGYYSKSDYVQLKYAKREAFVLSEYMYHRVGDIYLKRKHLKIRRSMRIIERRRGGEIGKHASFRS